MMHRRMNGSVSSKMLCRWAPVPQRSELRRSSSPTPAFIAWQGQNPTSFCATSVAALLHAYAAAAVNALPNAAVCDSVNLSD